MKTAKQTDREIERLKKIRKEKQKVLDSAMNEVNTLKHYIFLLGEHIGLLERNKIKLEPIAATKHLTGDTGTHEVTTNWCTCLDERRAQNWQCFMHGLVYVAPIYKSKMTSIKLGTQAVRTQTQQVIWQKDLDDRIVYAAPETGAPQGALMLQV